MYFILYNMVKLKAITIFNLMYINGIKVDLVLISIDFNPKLLDNLYKHC